jgi:hypothetical protein
MRDGKSIKQADLIEIKNNQTAFIMSRECSETMVAINNPARPYGIEAHAICDKSFKEMENICKQKGYPTAFVYLTIGDLGEIYISMECAKQCLPLAICVKPEAAGDCKYLNMSTIFVEDYAQENKLENEVLGC